MAAGLISGVLASLVSVFLLAKLFGLDHAQYVTLLPKSITTAIGMGYLKSWAELSQLRWRLSLLPEFWAMIGEVVFKIFRIQEPVAKRSVPGSIFPCHRNGQDMELGPVEGHEQSGYCGMVF